MIGEYIYYNSYIFFGIEMKVEKSKCKPLDFIYIDINTLNIFLLCLYIIYSNHNYSFYTLFFYLLIK